MSITQGIVLLFIGFLIFTLDKKQENIPVPTVLVFIGIGLSFIPYFSSIEVTEHMIYNVFLPPLLFVSAYRFSPAQLKKNIGIILFLATAGLVVTIGALGGLVYLISGPFLSISFLGALLLAAILTPTDPVSVVSILKTTTNNEEIADVVEGESLLNDGTSIVVFTFLLELYTTQQEFSLSSFLGEFAFVFAGGILLGITCGWLVSKGVHYTHNKEYQVMLSIVMAYGLFHLAEAAGVSGVLATVAGGLMLSFEYGRTNKEEHFKEALDGFWGVVEISALSLLFLLIGIAASSYLQTSIWGFAFLVFGLSIVVRVLVVSGTSSLFPSWRKHMSWRESIIISWSGLKGTMSVFLILRFQIEQAGGSSLFLSLAFATVLISLVIQSLGIYPLSKRLESH
ncbi:sodium:proton antiporter [Halobacillus locisalis]|uniref:Sodium:proton antiporter n=1 Tax=Halobacillus locisalis TaxID=220753 RepID=A0A838CW75_9BACI|nr:sodium:proton antiporter [Halobacillus locisalis]MBA2176015.1 sodium:proton antiporter [Halobacillus locisalis]